MSALVYALAAIFVLLGLGGIAYGFASPSGATSRKRLTAAAGPRIAPAARGTDPDQDRRKNVRWLVKDMVKRQAAKNPRPTMRRRIEQAGLTIDVRTFWIASAIAGLVAFGVCLLVVQSWLVALSAGFGTGLGLPRWTLAILKSRRQKKFTAEFANGIDVIVRSVRSGLPANEALKIVASEMPDPVGGEFARLVEALKVGVTMDQALKRMFERMPTPEVGFFGIVMTVQLKAGGNLSEALSNLASVLRDRKRLRAKISAMSAEAKASATIIGALPLVVMFLVYLTTPDYIKLLFTERMGKLMLAGCVVWMGLGAAVMKKMISFKQ